MVVRINAGELQPAPPKVAPAGAISTGDAVKAVVPTNEPPAIKNLLDKYPWLRFLPLLVLLIVALLVFLLAPGSALVVLGVAAPIMIGLYALLARWYRAGSLANSIQEEKQTPASVDSLPNVSNFVISRPGSGFTPSAGASDSAEGTRFKTALRDAYTYTSIKFPEPVKKPLNIPMLAQTIVAALDPMVTVPRRVFSTVMLPQWVIDNLVEQFTPVMAYPVFDVPMYKPLADLSSELFLPHINLIPPNSMTLLESNQRFIEAYMVGLNHEMARELLWREYLTDQRGSYFRQFWDVSMVLPPKPTPDDREKLRDIPELHTWSLHSGLGDHNQRAMHGQAAQLVLVIRGELLKRYPTAVIYAQKSQWHRKPDHTIDVSAERELVDLTPAEEDSLPADKIRMPLFEAKVDPDIYFIGFNLTALEARGGTKATDDPGWFFVIKERPGEPRFGLDDVPEGETPRLINWNDLAWKHIDTAPGQLIQLTKTLSFTPYSEPLDQEDKPVTEDVQAKWNPNTERGRTGLHSLPRAGPGGRARFAHAAMTNFADLRTQLAQKRADKDASAASLAVLREQLRKSAAADRRPAPRYRSARTPAPGALEKQAAALTQEIDRQRKTVAGLKAGASDLLGQLTAFADPTKQIEQLNDAFPILLFPVRLETRFHQPESPGRIGVSRRSRRRRLSFGFASIRTIAR